MTEGKFDGAFKLEGWNADPEKLFHLLSDKLGDKNIKRIAEADYHFAAKKNERDIRSMLKTKSLPARFESELKEVLELSRHRADLDGAFSTTVLFIADLQQVQCYYPQVTEAYVFLHSGAPNQLDPTDGRGPYETTYIGKRLQTTVAQHLPTLIQTCLDLESDLLDPLGSLLVSMVEEDLCRRFSLLALIIVAAHMDPKDGRISYLIDLLDEAEAHFLSVTKPYMRYPHPQHWLLGTSFSNRADAVWLTLSLDILGKSGVKRLEALHEKLTQPPDPRWYI